MKKFKIFFVISSNEYVRNYIETNVIDLIEKKYDVKYIINNSVSNKNKLNNNFIEYNTDALQDKILSNLFDVYMYKNIMKSSSFYFRFKRYGLSKKIPFFKTIFYFLKNLLKFNFSFFEYYFKSELIKIRSNKYFFPFYIRRVLNNIKINNQISKAFEEFKPNLIIFPSSAYEPISFDLIELSKIYNCKTFFLIDNWDNLSSKTILFKKPDYLGVWSEQCRQHAINIQNFDSAKIKIIGSARFQNYFSLRNQKLDSHFNFKYILFIGTTLEFDEYTVLKLLNSLISTNSDLFGFKVLYRPHPWRQSKNNQSLEALQNVEIDPQVEMAYSSNSNSFHFQPDLNYYPNLISNAEFVIGGLSSMLIESLIFNKFYIALVHDDNKHFTNQRNALKYYTHFRGIENLDNLYFCEKIENLASLINNLGKVRESFEFKPFESTLDYFIHGSISYSYNEILLNSVNEILHDN